MSWANPSPKLLRGSEVRTQKHAFAVEEVPMQDIEVAMEVTAEGHPPFGATSSQFVFVVTPDIPASEKARMKC